MRPIVRILLRYDIGYREFLEVLKIAYVDVASRDFEIRGRLTNISRVAVMTGLTRKEVRRIRDKITLGEHVKVKTTPMSDVLHHWYADAEFTKQSGEPLTLPFLGDGVTFSSLVRKFGGDIPADVMRTEMKRVGAVRENGDGTLTVIDRTFTSSDCHDKLITALIHGIYPLASNTEYNTDPSRDSDSWAHRIVYSKLAGSPYSGRIRRITHDRIVEFAESIDDIFMAHESAIVNDESASSGHTSPVAVGVFYFEERDQHAKYEW